MQQTKMDFSPPTYADEPKETHRAQFAEHADLLNFMFAGNATITLVSKKTGTRFTYRIKKPAPPETGEPGPVGWFVATLTGPDNTNDFTYLGHIYSTSKDYTHGRKSKIGSDAPSAQAFDWFYGAFKNGIIPQTLEIWHEGRCGKCNRKLTVPDSIANGIGPECAKQLHSMGHLRG